MQFDELQNKDSYSQCIAIPGTQAQTSGNYGYVLTARAVGLEIIAVGAKWETAATDLGTVTLAVVKVADGSAISTGTNLLASSFNLKTTADTWVYKAGKDLVSSTTTRFGRYIEPGESVALKVSGALTSLAGVHVCVYFKPANNGSYR